MSFDWRLFIRIADELISYPKTAVCQEAYIRTAISRYYYGVFCIARNIILSRGIEIKGPDKHKFVREQFLISRKNIEKALHDNLRRLCFRRVDADYNDEKSINFSEAEEAGILSEKTLKILEKLNAF